MTSNDGFYSGDAARTRFNHEIGAAFFYAAEKAGNRQRAIDLYVALSACPELNSLNRMFLDSGIRAAGINPERLWAAYQKLVP
ncbi:hypothetical protein [Actinoplanes sp. NPDC049118]|uniref:hypothetical protein n=1 Tax=Actinoplanes sp. NPDC049118 TaxID=3155769 RepID=UPI0033D517FC